MLGTTKTSQCSKHTIRPKSNTRRADPPEIRKPASQPSWFATRQTRWLGDLRPLEASSLGAVEWTGLVQSKRDECEYLHTYENDLGTAARDITATDRSANVSSCTPGILVQVQSGHLINQGARTRHRMRLVALSVSMSPTTIMLAKFPKVCPGNWNYILNIRCPCSLHSNLECA